MTSAGTETTEGVASDSTTIGLELYILRTYGSFAAAVVVGRFGKCIVTIR